MWKLRPARGTIAPRTTETIRSLEVSQGLRGRRREEGRHLRVGGQLDEALTIQGVTNKGLGSGTRNGRRLEGDLSTVHKRRGQGRRERPEKGL